MCFYVQDVGEGDLQGRAGENVTVGSVTGRKGFMVFEEITFGRQEKRQERMEGKEIK